MIRFKVLAALTMLTLCGWITKAASAQYPYEGFHGNDAYDHAHTLRDLGCGYQYDFYHPYHGGHSDHYSHGHLGPPAALSQHYAIPVYAEADCPYANEAICRQPIGCPLQRGQTYPNQPTDEYRPGFGLQASGHDHSHSGDGHSGHSHGGHSHEGHSHDFQAPNRDVAPLDRGYIAPPSLPRDSIGDFQPEQDFRREQPQRDDSIRMDSPPPSFEPNSPSSPREDTPKRFDVPPPSTV